MAIQTVKTGAAVNDGTGDDARTAFTKINQNFTDNTNAASRQVGTGAGNVMEVGAFGLGAKSYISSLADPLSTPSTKNELVCGQYYYGLNFKGQEPNAWGRLIFPYGYGNAVATPTFVYQLFGDPIVIAFLTNRNTKVDPNGFIKNASPIVSLYADKIELNDEAKQQTITFEKLGVGDYLVKGSTGFAQEGWYIETPKDANGNVLVAVVYEQLANNDISVKTYDYMLNKKGRIVPDLKTPLDIPETRWIDLRLQALPQDDTQPLDTDKTVATNAE